MEAKKATPFFVYPGRIFFVLAFLTLSDGAADANYRQRDIARNEPAASFQ